MSDSDFISIESVAAIEGKNVEDLKRLIYRKTDYNYLRFKIVNGKLFMRADYEAPLKEDLDRLRQKALIIAKTENNLCSELSKLSKNKIKKETLQKYFYRYRFKQIAKAIRIIDLLKKYISQNSLINESDLKYD